MVRDILNDLAVEFGLVDDRAGRYSRQLARERRRAFVQESWRRLIVVFLIGTAAVVPTLFLPSWSRGFIAGAWLASLAWLMALVVIQGSGSTPAAMGASAEQWTFQELRRLRRRGWKVLSHITPTYGDIDQVAIGPGGLIVLETKWRSDPLGFNQSKDLAEACRQLVANTRRIRLSLQARLKGAPVRMVLVCWGPSPASNELSSEKFEVDGVQVIPGSMLRRWLDTASLTGPVTMDAASINSAWKTLTEIARNTDRREFGEGGQSAPPMRRLLDVGLGLIAGLGALLAGSLAFRWLRAPLFVPIEALVAGAALIARKSTAKNSPVRVVGLGVVVGSSAFVSIAAALYGYDALTHL